MIVRTYYCDICKKRIRNNQKVWFEGEHHYHFWCKYKEEDPLPHEIMDKHRFPKSLSEFK